MATKLEYVIQHALRTFRHSHRKLPECSVTELNELRSLANEITISDIGRLRNILNPNELKEFMFKKKTSLDYIPVYEDYSITVGVFLLKQGTKLPIHDHPNMHGIIKVLQGKLKITSYSVIDIESSINGIYSSMYYNHPLKVIKHPEVILTNENECCMLTPTEKNIHEVECIEGPAAFLDILSPPYEDGSSEEPRTCHYFQEHLPSAHTDSNEIDDCLRLVQVPSPF
ncbi:conserved hypothetical protein [Pediculus humanus corporis]|mgnify:CR=1 FL=1|uniref:2-aminoethanethiol dioxygenase n=1 Tax=Pediculus humanus subsp. corporis TaxID=121224 RepID=E0VLM0_PEDHC|nr:uncharacterized protein Phum_PHUM289820 [Pediculus humanus corporis]EEB14276.1 conserved hypothetical protein [Pediculus humanus corporis]